jgi:hypothetical protein
VRQRQDMRIASGHHHDETHIAISEIL